MDSDKIQGYIFATAENLEFLNVKAGDHIVKSEKVPPYFVVDHLIHKIVLTRWPGRLYRVEVWNEVEKEINKGLVKNIWYTRTFGVKIIEELPRGFLFGANGEDICKIVDIAANINVNEAELLNKYPLDITRKLYSKVWELWANLEEQNDYDRSNNWEGILAAHPKERDLISPISHATSLIDSLCYKRAQVLEGDQAIDIDEEGEISLKPKWSVACEHSLNAAMSYESYNFLNEEEKLQMRKPIIEVLAMV